MRFYQRQVQNRLPFRMRAGFRGVLNGQPGPVILERSGQNRRRAEQSNSQVKTNRSGSARKQKCQCSSVNLSRCEADFFSSAAMFVFPDNAFDCSHALGSRETLVHRLQLDPAQPICQRTINSGRDFSRHDAYKVGSARSVGHLALSWSRKLFLRPFDKLRASPGFLLAPLRGYHSSR